MPQASVARMSEAISGTGCEPPACRCAHGGYIGSLHCRVARRRGAGQDASCLPGYTAFAQPAIRGGFQMAQNGTVIVRAALNHERSIYRDIEIETSKSLYGLAEAIVGAFDFDFDHAFGFYSGLTPARMTRQHPRYELFADMG